MRHRVYGKHFGRDIDQRRALFKGLVQSLILHGTIQTSEAKAKAIKGLVDKVITLAKSKNTQGKLQSYFPEKVLLDRVKEILPKLGNRTSGYTKLIKTGPRLGDQTTMVKMSLIGAEELKPFKKELKSHEISKESEIKDKKVETKIAEKKIATAKKPTSTRKPSPRKK